MQKTEELHSLALYHSGSSMADKQHEDYDELVIVSEDAGASKRGDISPACLFTDLTRPS